MRRPRATGARPVVTGRALVLGGVLVLLVVLLAAPVHRYLASRSEVQHTAQRLADDRAARTALQAQKARWSDPGYIERQARTRLQFAMPGDTVYIVVDKGQRSDIERSAGTTSKPASGPAWNTRLWDSVRAAGT
ncbi:MAG TPA: septum formation initiator family protein [Jatrophihabitans sp.]|nr:septum formation initiator family protein [Jatrophihabitans sp.]